jgi:hypothetical protein
MFSTLLLLLAASAGPTPPRQDPPSSPGQTPPPSQMPPPSHSPPRHDPPPANLATLTTACPAAPTGEIIVCGTRLKDRYRLPPLAPADAPRLGPAEFGILGARVGVVTEQGRVGPIPTNRVMARVKIRF